MRHPPGSLPKTQGRRKRRGSRLLLAASLLAGVVAALILGASVMEAAAGLAGIASGTVRLVLKVIGVALALPVAFYAIERFFLARSGGRGGSDNDGGR